LREELDHNPSVAFGILLPPPGANGRDEASGGKKRKIKRGEK
jgi:hypothetical protein